MSRAPCLQFLVSMSSRSPSRGGRNQWRRGFSDRPFNGGRTHLVSGDSHFRSVRDSNLGFRQGNLSNHQLRPPPPFNPNQQFRHPPPPYRQNQAVRPRPPKPPDYRSWDYAKVAPPPNTERFVVLSYNILADYLAINHRSKLYFHIPRHILDWEWRKRSIVFELGLWSADIMCLQEVDRFQDLETELKLRGYSGILKMRTGNAIDGCAIFWRTSRFKLLYEEGIEFNNLGLRDNVAQICVLELLSKKFNKNTAPLPTSSAHNNKVIICNIHVLFNPKRGEIKLGQVRTLLDRAYAVSKIWNDAPVVLCGDFNCTPKSPLYNFISEQKLDLSEVDRDKVSGQASAEIRAPKPYNPNPRSQPADVSIQPPLMVGRGEFGIKPSDRLSDSPKDNKDGDIENISFLDNSSLSQCTDTLISVSDKACSDMQCGNEDSALIAVVTKETQQTVLDGSKESLDCTQREGPYPTDQYQINDESHKFSPPGDSHPVDKFDETKTVLTEKANASSHLNHGSPSEHSESNINIENDSSNCDDSMLFLVGNDHSSRAECNSGIMNTSDPEISSTKLSSPTCSSDATGISGKFSSLSSTDDKRGSCSTPYQPEVSTVPTSLDFLVDKLENLSMRNLDEAKVEGESIDEDDNTFLSASHNSEDAFQSDSGLFARLNVDPSEEPDDGNFNDISPALASFPVDVENATYDPSLWTPMEIATATGNADCTFLEHPLQLKSTYAEVEDCAGTRDSNGEPLVTSYNRCFMGTVDYIWRSKGLQTLRVLAPIPKHAMQWTPGFPTKKWGSDHIALASEVAFLED